MAEEKALDGLLNVAAKIDERHRLIERLRTQKWTASEAAEWRTEIIRLGDDAFVALPMFDEYIAKAQAENRYTDDLSPSWRNIRAKVDPKLWVVTASDAVISLKYARSLDAGHEPFVAMIRVRDRVPVFDLSTGFYGMGDGQERLVPRVAQTWGDACMAWVRDIEGHKGISAEHWHGVCAEEALPPWATAEGGIMPPSYQSGAVMPGTSITGVSRLAFPEEVPRLIEGQRLRWKHWERSRRLCWSAILSGQRWQEVIPALEGFCWIPCPGDLSEYNPARNQRVNSEASGWMATVKDRAVRELDAASDRRAHEERERIGRW